MNLTDLNATQVQAALEKSYPTEKFNVESATFSGIEEGNKAVYEVVVDDGQEMYYVGITHDVYGELIADY